MTISPTDAPGDGLSPTRKTSTHSMDTASVPVLDGPASHSSKDDVITLLKSYATKVELGLLSTYVYIVPVCMCVCRLT